MEKAISPKSSIAILLGSLSIVLAVGLIGALAGSSYDSSCTTTAGEEPVCTTRYAYKGLGNVDINLPSLQAIAGALGVGFGVYAAVKNGKFPKLTGGGDDVSGAG